MVARQLRKSQVCAQQECERACLKTEFRSNRPFGFTRTPRGFVENLSYCVHFAQQRDSLGKQETCPDALYVRQNMELLIPCMICRIRVASRPNPTNAGDSRRRASLFSTLDIILTCSQIVKDGQMPQASAAKCQYEVELNDGLDPLYCSMSGRKLCQTRDCQCQGKCPPRRVQYVSAETKCLHSC